MTTGKRRDFIYSLEKGLFILGLFSKHGPELSLSELAKAVNMGMGNATRYVNTLMDLGYLARDPSTKKYRLAPKILSLGFSLLKDLDLRARLTPYLAETTRELGVGSHCAILDETEIVYIERFRSHTLVALDLTIGSRLPAYCTALGRAILAFTDTKLTQCILAKTQMTPLTPYTIVDKNEFYRELELTRKRGYAINVQELVLGQAALATPVFHTGRIEGALGFSFPHTFMEDEKFTSTLIERMMDIATKGSVGERSS